MSLWQSYRNLTPKSKALFGAGLLAWGLIGLTFGEAAEAKLGYTPTEADKAALEKMKPKIHAVERGDQKGSDNYGREVCWRGFVGLGGRVEE